MMTITYRLLDWIRWIRLLLPAMALPVAFPNVLEAASARPNLVFILADDLGYGDLGCYGNKAIKTPHLDALAAQGVRFTQFYANGPECTPTRAAFLTGRYQQRVGGLECALGVGNVGRYDDAIRLRASNELGLPASETTLARVLKRAGYATVLIGKWHLGYDPKFFPKEHGFDHWFGVIGGNADYFHHTEEDGLHSLYLNGQTTRRDGYLTDLITEEAVRFVEQPGEKPFFLFVAYTAAHTPIQGPQDRQAQPRAREEWNRGSPAGYRAMIERMDEGIGQIMRSLGARGLAANTVVVFTSDNGGTRLSRNEPFRGTKGTTFEGGIRVPCLARWPGVLPAGVAADRVGITMDLTASFARIAGATWPAERKLDGVDILNELEKDQPPRTRTLFWRGRRGENTWKAVRDGSLKYVLSVRGHQIQEQLFDLQTDPSENHDLIAVRRDDWIRLQELLNQWEKRCSPGSLVALPWPLA